MNAADLPAISRTGNVRFFYSDASEADGSAASPERPRSTSRKRLMNRSISAASTRKVGWGGSWQVPLVIILEHDLNSCVPRLIDTVETQPAISPCDGGLTTSKLIRPLVSSIRRKARSELRSRSVHRDPRRFEPIRRTGCSRRGSRSPDSLRPDLRSLLSSLKPCALVDRPKRISNALDSWSASLDLRPGRLRRVLDSVITIDYSRNT